MEAYAYITSAKGVTTYFMQKESGWWYKVVCEGGKRALTGKGIPRAVYGAKFQGRIAAVIADIEEAAK